MFNLQRAFETRDVKEFMDLVFPPHWGGIKARILETGVCFVELTPETEKFALGWSFVTPTVRSSKRGDGRETWFKSVIFRVHDVLHQLFSIYVPQDLEAERSQLKRMWMCAEIAVLTLTEFYYCEWLYDTQPELREFLESRNTLLFKRTTQLRYKSLEDIASTLDQLLHLKQRPGWVEDSPHGRAFLADFVPMLEEDRYNIDHNLRLLQEQKDKDWLAHMPNPCYGTHLDGRELTVWMIRYFQILLETGERVDEGLREFNRQRRERVSLPDTWNEPPQEKSEEMWSKLEQLGYAKKK